MIFTTQYNECVQKMMMQWVERTGLGSCIRAGNLPVMVGSMLSTNGMNQATIGAYYAK